ncbi:protein SIEVE ELEMENT OCCLUSION B [Cinnamomum micranthum f. kanehirae]|uniref:Protein SIEVE ELEMENT OCCLUSION B n=1 Tax=Cinnamomum micranthum f. kanehirae TaxID=337451 RepID=A0A443Q1U4_9MAGN|nr:protein SIEVE ELEMENT OCCLUSION B [Cinnamomum micranthum f. kanehirae]
MHADGREVEVRLILDVVEDVLKRSTPTIVVATSQETLDAIDEKAQRGELVGMLEALAYTIHKIACEISCKCTGGGDAHATTMALLNTLGSYSWDAKVVLALAAFAASFGEFWLTVQLHTVNPLAKSVALLKQLPNIFEHTEALKPKFDALNALIKAMLDVTKSIIELKELPQEYISPDTPAMLMAVSHIPTAVYWTIRGVVACSSQIVGLIGMGHEYITSTTEAWELSSLAHKVSNIYGHLRNQLIVCHQHIVKRLRIEIILIELPDLSDQRNYEVSIDILRRKIVILFISDIDILHEELAVLMQIYNESQHGKSERNFEVVWLPVVDRSVPWTETKQELFGHLASSMPWYSLHDPSLLEPAVYRYIKEVWHFAKKPLLVVLDGQGRVVCPNALHMIWIWGGLAFPFTSSREDMLWKEETWRIELLVDYIDPMMHQWIREGRFICLYGGEDLEWIRKFTSVMRKVAVEIGLPLEMIYVGKGNPKERVRKINTAITEEKLSSCWHDLVMIWFFWARLESMWYSKVQLGRTIENDAIMQEVMTMLTFDSSDEGWALISKGSTEMVKDHGKKMVDCLSSFDNWKENVEHDGFIAALAGALVPYHTDEHCTRLILPGTTGVIQEKVICAECRRPMEKYILYRCCLD